MSWGPSTKMHIFSTGGDCVIPLKCLPSPPKKPLLQAKYNGLYMWKTSLKTPVNKYVFDYYSAVKTAS